MVSRNPLKWESKIKPADRSELTKGHFQRQLLDSLEADNLEKNLRYDC